MTLKEWKKRIGQWINNFPDRAINVAGIALSLLIALWGIFLTLSNNRQSDRMQRLAERQDTLMLSLIRLQEQQNKTALDIAHFNELLDKTKVILSKDSELVVLSTNQIDSLSILDHTLLKQLGLLNDQYSLSKEVHVENRIERANKKIQDYKKVLGISEKLSDLTGKWAIAKFRVLTLKIYPPIEYYDTLCTEGNDIMSLFTNRFELIFDSALNERWRITNYLFNRHLMMRNFTANMLKGIPKDANFTAQPVSEVNENNFLSFNLADSMSITLQNWLNTYANDKINTLNNELKILSLKHE